MKTSPANHLAIHIRRAQVTDAERIAALATQLGYPATPTQIRSRLRHLLKDRNHAVWVAEVRGGPVAGWIHVFIQHLLESDPEAELGGLVVDEALRGCGAGKLLVRRAEQWAKSRKLQSVGLRSNIVRRQAHAFYQQLGYEIIKTQHAFRKAVSR